MSHPLGCRCGKVSGSVDRVESTNRVICYCKDCQAFARFLGREDEILDERGGSDIIQALPKNVTFHQGIDSLACMQLTSKGLLRWYTRCCRTPIGNTLATPKWSFIGLLHSCLTQTATPLDASFGPVRSWVNTSGAKGEPKPATAGQAAVIGWFMRTTLRARINGDYRDTPLFQAGTGKPLVAPQVLNSSELARVRPS